MRVVALLHTHNEERFVAGLIEHLHEQGAEVLLTDNGSTDRTVEIAEQYRGRGLLGIETIPHEGHFDLYALLRLREQQILGLDADWIMTCDADEIHTAPWPGMTLRDAFARVEADGYNAVNFQEFTFLPTREEPDHDDAHFRETMKWYYPFLPSFPHRLNAWKHQSGPIELAWSGGHQVRFPGLKMHPTTFIMKHYIYLSSQHAAEKYDTIDYSREDLNRGWHGWRIGFDAARMLHPPQSELRVHTTDEQLDASRPWKSHFIERVMASNA